NCVLPLASVKAITVKLPPAGKFGVNARAVPEAFVSTSAFELTGRHAVDAPNTRPLLPVATRPLFATVIGRFVALMNRTVAGVPTPVMSLSLVLSPHAAAKTSGTARNK